MGVSSPGFSSGLLDYVRLVCYAYAAYRITEGLLVARPPETHLSFRFNGPVGPDTYSFGFHVVLNGIIDSTAPVMQAIADDAITRVNALWNASGGLEGLNASYLEAPDVEVRLYSGGTLLATGEAATTEGAGTGSGTQPPYVCFAVTLLTLEASRSGRGRFFLPMTGTNMDGTGRLPTFFSTSTGTAVRTFLQAFNTGYNDEQAEGQVAVLSLTKTQILPVVQMRIDDMPDTQRGRKSKWVPGVRYVNSL